MQKDKDDSNSNSAPVFHFLTHKAGMDAIDPQKVSQIVMEASKNSEYYKHEQEKKQKYDEKISEMLKSIEHLSRDSYQTSLIDQQIENNFHTYEQERYLKKVWVHFDLDMFYVACEIRDNPSLEGKPVAVGGLSMIATANYIARKFGVRSAMPGFIAKKLCPDLLLIQGNYKKYEETSKIFKDILGFYDPEQESMGLDEANLDMTNYFNENNIRETYQIEELCKKIRMEINEKTKITVSCGIAPNKMLAKMCSEVNKPNGQFLLKNDKEEILNFMGQRPIRKIPGIGNVNEQLLIGLGIHTCEDILKKKREIKICFTENAFEFFMKAALGISRCFHEKFEDRKSISVSRTFQAICDYGQMEMKLKELSESLGDDLEHLKKLSKHISVNAKTHKFEVKSKNMMLDKYIKSSEEVFSFASKLLKQLWPLDPVRLLGIKLGDLINEKELKEKSIEKYFVKAPEIPKYEDNPEIQEDLILADEIDKILKNEFSNDKNDFPKKTKEIEDLQIFEEKKNESSKKEFLNNTKKTKENKIPQYFVCFICNQEINCGGNSIRMNNHIDKCLMSQNKKEEQVNFETVENVFESNKKRKTSNPSPDVNQDSRKNLKTTKKDNKNVNKNKTLESFFSKKT